MPMNASKARTTPVSEPERSAMGRESGTNPGVTSTQPSATPSATSSPRIPDGDDNVLHGRSVPAQKTSPDLPKSVSNTHVAIVPVYGTSAPAPPTQTSDRQRSTETPSSTTRPSGSEGSIVPQPQISLSLDASISKDVQVNAHDKRPNPFLPDADRPEEKYVTDVVAFLAKVGTERQSVLEQHGLVDLKEEMEEMAKVWAVVERGMGYPAPMVSYEHIVSS